MLLYDEIYKLQKEKNVCTKKKITMICFFLIFLPVLSFKKT